LLVTESMKKPTRRGPDPQNFEDPSSFHHFEATEEAVLITRSDGIIEFVNPAFEKLTGFSRDEAIGSTPRLLKSGLESPDRYSALWKTILSGKPWRGIFRDRRKDGSVVHVEDTITPVLDRHGKPVRFIGVLCEAGPECPEPVPDERQNFLVRMLEGVADEWQRTFDAVGFPLFVFDERGAILRANQAGLLHLGLGSNEEADHLCVGPSRDPVWSVVLEQLAIAHKDQVIAESTIDGGLLTRSWAIRVAPVKETGMSNRYVVFLRESSVEVRSQEIVRRQEEDSTFTSLVAGFAQESRNPIFAVSAIIDAFEARFGSAPELAEFGIPLRKELARLGRMVDELLELGRPFGTNLVPLHLEEVIEDARAACASTVSLAEKQGVTIKTENLSTRTLSGDRAGLGRAVQSILENAIEHSPAGGTVWMSARDEETFSSIVIEDAGPGFPPGDLPFVFVPFFARRQAGVGLGLAIARRVIRQHGGEVSAANRPMGGAVVQLNIPAR